MVMIPIYPVHTYWLDGLTQFPPVRLYVTTLSSENDHVSPRNRTNCAINALFRRRFFSSKTFESVSCCIVYEHGECIALWPIIIGGNDSSSSSTEFGCTGLPRTRRSEWKIEGLFTYRDDTDRHTHVHMEHSPLITFFGLYGVRLYIEKHNPVSIVHRRRPRNLHISGGKHLHEALIYWVAIRQGRSSDLMRRQTNTHEGYSSSSNKQIKRKVFMFMTSDPKVVRWEHIHIYALHTVINLLLQRNIQDQYDCSNCSVLESNPAKHATPWYCIGCPDTFCFVLFLFFTITCMDDPEHSQDAGDLEDLGSQTITDVHRK